jgi:hypothetical protein
VAPRRRCISNRRPAETIRWICCPVQLKK